MRKPLAFALVLSALALFPATALAASMPKPTTTKVVVPTSIAGVKLDMPEAKAKAAWGGAGRGKCVSAESSGNSRCEYGNETGPNGWAWFECSDGKVVTVVVYAGKNANNEYVASAAAALEKIQTADGIGIGAKFSELKSGYPKGTVLGSSSDKYFNYSLTAPKGEFSFGIAGSKVYAIGLSYQG